MRTLGRAGWACWAVVAVVAVGCAPDDRIETTGRTDPPRPTRTDDPATIDEGESPVFVSPPPPSGGGDQLAAIVGGVIVLDRGCLLLDQYAHFADLADPPDPAAVRYPVIWPAGTTWDDATQTVVLPDGVRAAIGESVGGGGGYLYEDAIAVVTDPNTAARAAACAGPTGEIAWFNPGGEVVLDDAPFD